MKTVSLNELVYELLELRRAYIKDTDTLDRRIVIDWIQSQRARLLKQRFDQPFISIDDHYVQNLGSVPMEKVLSNISGVDNYDYMWRTAVEVPRVISNRIGTGCFTRIGPTDRLSDHFHVTTYKKAILLGYGKFNHNSIYAFPLGDHIYLTSNGGLHFTIKNLDIHGVFQDPIAAARFKNPDWTYDDDYPVNKELIDQLKMLIVREKFELTLLQAHDKIDNQEDNIEGNARVPKGQEEDNSGL